MAGVTG
ncbi:23S rRNA (guanosine-2'-O-)-methyltransferase RlmB, partial [Yersinia pestis PY-34]